MKKLVRYFLQGLLYIAPLGVSIYIIYILFVFFDGLFESYINDIIPFSIPGLGVITIIIIVTLLGFIGQTIIARPIVKLIDKTFKKAPLIKLIYSSLKDLLSAFMGKEKKFNKPVLVKVNTISNLEKLGFITQTDLSDLKISGKVAVYFPHSYNFSGELFIVPSELVTPIEIAPAETMKFIVSGGVTKV